ncbi:MAG TPA: hypothetical protein VNS58_03710 [Puia sp.]|nr:hypothetical protein [Puia sp.]
MSPDPQPNTIAPLSAKDKITLKKLKDQAYFTLAKTYGPFFLALAFLYYRMTPGSTFRGHRLNYEHMTRSDYNLVFWILAILFGGVFLLFLVRDYRRRVIPLKKEMLSAKKYCIPFVARKYKDPLYNKCLLFYPGKEDFYIEIPEKDFDAIRNGENMQLEAACITGEVLLVRSESITCEQASEFSFSDEVITSNK